MTSNPPEHIFKSYDIRGIYPDEINEKNVVDITKAIYSFLTSDHDYSSSYKIALARDMRLSSPKISSAIKRTLLNLGTTVYDLGITSTPTMYFAVHNFGYHAGVIITASHNPKQYNGIKIVKNSHNGLIKIGKSTGMEQIKKLSVDGVDVSKTKKGKVFEINNVLDKEIKNSLRIAGKFKIKKFKVVADAANAMGATYINALFNKIPGKIIKMNFKLDGTFPAHQADPLQHETLIDLQKRVIEENADLGLAPDGDGDRLFFIDEKGQIIPPSIITALVAKELLKKNKGEKVLFDIRYIFNAKHTVETNGGIPVITKVGHAFITEQLHDTGGIFAGESSAHFFFRGTGNAESQIPVILFVLKVMSKEKKKLSEIVSELKVAHESGEINFKVKNAIEILEAIKKHYSDGDISTLDGIAVSYPSWRFSIRTSNTEPLLRLNVEGYNFEEMEMQKNNLVNLIENQAAFS